MVARLRSGFRWNLAVTSGAVLVAALMLATSFSDRLVGAQSSTSTPTTAATSMPYQEIANELAQQLGLDPAQVEAALEQVLGPANMDMGMIPSSDEFNELASALDLPSFFGESPSSLDAELAQGMTLAEIAEAHGKTTGDLKAYLTQEFAGAANSIVDQLISQPFVQGIIDQLINVPLSMPSAAATPAM